MSCELRHFLPRSAGRRTTIAGPGLLVGVVIILSGMGSAMGQEQSRPEAGTAGESTGPDVPATEKAGSPKTGGEDPAAHESRADRPVETADREQVRRRAFLTGVVMLGGILICGVGLIAIVLLWGNRTRRIARQALPKVAPRDELWYLKHKIETDAALPDDRDKNDGDSAAETRA